jgi:hypothetical protein
MVQADVDMEAGTLTLNKNFVVGTAGSWAQQHSLELVSKFVLLGACQPTCAITPVFLSFRLQCMAVYPVLPCMWALLQLWLCLHD